MEMKLCPLSMALVSALLLGETIYLIVSTVTGNFAGALSSMLYFGVGLLLIAILSNIFC